MTHKAAWAAYIATPEFAALSIHATHYKHVEASLEAAFVAGRAGAFQEAVEIVKRPQPNYDAASLIERIAVAIRAAKEQP